MNHLLWTSGWARKRHGNSQLILIELKSEEYRNRFLQLCCENPHVLRIEEINEEDFTNSPSHEV